MVSALANKPPSGDDDRRNRDTGQESFLAIGHRRNITNLALLRRSLPVPRPTAPVCEWCPRGRKL